MKKRIVLMLAVMLAVLCGSAMAKEYRVTSEEELNKAFIQVDNDDVVVIAEPFTTRAVVRTPDKSITIIGGNGPWTLRDSLILGGNLELKSIDLEFIESSHAVGTDERSIFLEGHDLTIHDDVVIRAKGWNDTYRYCSIYAYQDGTGKQWENTLTIMGGTYDIIKAGSKKGSGMGQTTVKLSGDTYLTTQLDGGSGEETSTITLDPTPGFAPLAMGASIVGNSDLTLNGVHGRMDAPVSISSVSCRQLALSGRTRFLTYGEIDVRGDLRLPSGNALTVYSGHIGGNFSGGGILGLSGGGLTVDGAVSETTELSIGSFWDGFEAVKAGANPTGGFSPTNMGYSLQRREEEGMIIWWTDVPEAEPVVFESVGIRTRAFSGVDGRTMRQDKIVVGRETTVVDYLSVRFYNIVEDASGRYELEVSGVIAEEMKLTLPNDSEGVYILKQPDSFTHAFQLAVEPGYGSRQLDLTVTVKYEGKTYAGTTPVTIVEGWLMETESMDEGTYVTDIQPEYLSLKIGSTDGWGEIEPYTAYCGLYNSGGQLLNLGTTLFEAQADEDYWPKMQNVSFPDLTIPEDAAYWKVFVLDQDLHSVASIKVLLPELASETAP